jgi:hypothetical protein
MMKQNFKIMMAPVVILIRDIVIFVESIAGALIRGFDMLLKIAIIVLLTINMMNSCEFSETQRLMNYRLLDLEEQVEDIDFIQKAQAEQKIGIGDPNEINSPESE